MRGLDTPTSVAGGSTRPEEAPRVLTRALALLLPPVVVLGSAHELYLRNQRELHQTVSVLYPFWAAAATAMVAGALLQRLDRRGGARAALWGYYATGLAFLLWGFLRGLPLASGLASWTLDTAAGSALFVAACLTATAVVARRRGPRSLEPFLAVLAVVLTAREVASLATQLDLGAPPSVRDIPVAFGAGGESRLPNVYHVLLDSLPADLFDACLPPGGQERLDGFVRVRLNAPLRHTMTVLPLMLSGAWALDPRRGLANALAGDASLFSDFRRVGYRSVGFVPSFLYRGNKPALDTTVYLDESVYLDGRDTVRIRAMHRRTFRQLWAYSVLPLALGRELARGNLLGLDAEPLRSIEAVRMSALAEPVVSKLGLERFLEAEPLLPSRGRYTFVHLLLPHPPHVLRSDCSNAEGFTATDLKQQTDCTLLLVSRFLDTLEGLGRLDGAVVFIHGDHGAGQVLRDGRLEPDPSSELRTLLLAKAVGAHGPLRQAREAAAVVDLAPTLLALAGVTPTRALDGRVLGEVLTSPDPRRPGASRPSGSRTASTTGAQGRSSTAARSTGVAP